MQRLVFLFDIFWGLFFVWVVLNVGHYLFYRGQNAGGFFWLSNKLKGKSKEDGK